MYLTEYLSEVTKAVEEYSQTGFIISSEIKIDVWLSETTSTLQESLSGPTGF
ncbi:MAG: hypothetical protein M1461_08245 [Nitrospirae bacterium]|nr:hypothetical protein [Nitrospirota bacterium]